MGRPQTELRTAERGFWRNEISRAELLASALAQGGISLFARGRLDDEMGTRVVNGRGRIKEIWNSLESDGRLSDIHSLDRLLQLSSREHKFHIGMLHHRWPGAVHPDDVAAAGYLRRVLLNGPRKVTVQNFLPLDDYSGNFVCFGDAVPSFLVRSCLQYRMEAKGNGRGLYTFFREKDPVIDLAFEVESDPNTKDFIDREVLKTKYYSAPVRIHDLTTNTIEYFKPLVDDKGRLITDYLLISVVPNILDRKSYLRGDTITVISGAHGVATRSLGLLLSSEFALANLASEVDKVSNTGDTKYWQALIEVDQIQRRNGTDLPLGLGEYVHVRGVGINQNALDVWINGLPKDFELKPTTKTISPRISRAFSAETGGDAVGERDLITEPNQMKSLETTAQDIDPYVAREIASKTLAYYPQTVERFADAYRKRSHATDGPEKERAIVGLPMVLCNLLYTYPDKLQTLEAHKVSHERTVLDDSLRSLFRQSIARCVQTWPKSFEAFREHAQELELEETELLAQLLELYNQNDGFMRTV